MSATKSPAAADAAATAPEMAAFSQRFFALMADWLMCLFLANAMIRLGWLPGPEQVWPSVVLVVEYTVFLTFFTQTPGMRLLRIHCVTTRDGAALGLTRAAGRAVLLSLFVPVLTAFSDPHRRGLHDKAVGSAMVR